MKLGFFGSMICMIDNPLQKILKKYNNNKREVVK